MVDVKEQPHTLKQIADMMKMSPQGAKAWIKVHCPSVYEPKNSQKRRRKGPFSPGEVTLIMQEWHCL